MDHESKAKSRRRMIETNVRQKAFYERVRKAGSFKKATDNRATKLWSVIRNKVWDFRSSTGILEQSTSLHRKWIDEAAPGKVLDLGCGRGSALSFLLAEKSGEYIGIDLASEAVDQLNVEFRSRGLANAQAIELDFLTNSFPDSHFDVIYAQSVLHHFRDTSVLVDELHRVLKPGGLILSIDPMQTEPLNRLARAVYRLRQSDRDWEWPFTRATFEMLQARFDLAEVRGLLGMSKCGLPFYFVPGLSFVGESVAKWGMRFDNRYANRVGVPLFLCWHVSLVLRKPGAH